MLYWVLMLIFPDSLFLLFLFIIFSVSCCKLSCRRWFVNQSFFMFLLKWTNIVISWDMSFILKIHIKKHFRHVDIMRFVACFPAVLCFFPKFASCFFLLLLSLKILKIARKTHSKLERGKLKKRCWRHTQKKISSICRL